jgi:shikimate dehydrogenase
MRAAVLGSPVSHSLSPVLHRAAYDALGLPDWTYEAVEVDEAGLPGFLARLDPSWRGLSLTMPLKRAVLPLLDEVSPLARQVEAVNTVVLADGHRSGDNTDITGMVAALAEAGVTTARSAAVLGAGATACSAVAALARLGVPAPVVHARRPHAADEVRRAGERLGVRPDVRAWPAAVGELDGFDVVVSTTPSGSTDTLAPAAGSLHGVLFDVLYEPWPTRLAAAWGGPVVGGLALLVHQAVLQVRLMTGEDVPAEVLRVAGERALADRATSPRNVVK